jgi:toxin ParE1/3/4
VSLRVVYERLARQDIDEHADYIAEERPLSALEFVNAIERDVVRLAEMPALGSPRAFQHPRLAGIRMWVLTGFRNYLLFYRVAGDALQVLRVLHAAQDYTRFFHEDDDRC